jgi:hypothetical protein
MKRWLNHTCVLLNSFVLSASCTRSLLNEHEIWQCSAKRYLSHHNYFLSTGDQSVQDARKVSVSSGNVIADDQVAWYIDSTFVANGLDVWVTNPEKGKHEVRLEVTEEGVRISATSTIDVLPGSS